MEARASDVIAGGDGAAGPASDVLHQPAGDVYQQFDIGHTKTILWLIFSEALVVQWYRQPCSVFEIIGSNQNIMTMFCFCTYWLVQRYPRLYWDIQGCIEIYSDVLSWVCMSWHNFVLDISVCHGISLDTLWCTMINQYVIISPSSGK